MNAPSSDLPAIVRLGSRVILDIIDEQDHRERLALDVVPDAAADFAAGFLGEGTPMAQAILGRPAGAVIPYRLADIVEVRVVEITPSERAPEESAASARDAATQEAIERSNLEDIVRLALTVDVKWGEYDPEVLEPPDVDG
jgi:hypothetical protein